MPTARSSASTACCSSSPRSCPRRSSSLQSWRSPQDPHHPHRPHRRAVTSLRCIAASTAQFTEPAFSGMCALVPSNGDSPPALGTAAAVWLSPGAQELRRRGWQINRKRPPRLRREEDYGCRRHTSVLAGYVDGARWASARRAPTSGRSTACVFVPGRGTAPVWRTYPHDRLILFARCDSGWCSTAALVLLCGWAA